MFSDEYAGDETAAQPDDTFLSLAREYVRARDYAGELGLKISSLSEEHKKVADKRDAIKRQLIDHLEPQSKALGVDAAMKEYQARGGIR